MPRKKQTGKLPSKLQKAAKIAVANDLGTALFGGGYLSNPYNYTTELSQSETLFKNNRWYMVSNFRQLLNEIYAEHGVVQAVVDVPVEDGLRGELEITSQQLSPDQVKQLKNEMERQGDLLIMAQTMKWNRLFGGAGTIIVTDQDPSYPLQINKINKDTPLGFKAADMWELFWSNNTTFDPSNIEVVEQGAPLDETQMLFNYYGVNIHRSRVMIQRGKEAPSFIRPRLRGWGLSVIECMVRSINQYLKATDLTFEVLDEFKIDVFKIKNLATTLLQPGGEQKVYKRMQLANLQKNFQNAITMDADDDFIAKELTFNGIAETMGGIRMQIAADLRMPLTKIFGISAAGFNSGEDDIENYNAMVEATIRSKAKYDILKMCELRCQKLFGIRPTDLTIDFEPLRVLSAEQEENVKTQKFNRLHSSRTAGLITDKEFRDACNKDDLLGIQLDADVELDLDVNSEEQGDDNLESGSSPESSLNADDAKEAKT